MKNTIQKIKNLFWLQLLSIIFVVGIVPVALFLSIVWLKVVIVLGISALNVFIIYYTYSKAKKLEKQLQDEIQEYNDKKKKTTLLDIYGILGIPPQYKPDGSLKDIFDLLGIEPQYDENGRRVATVYERLGINPRFTLDGLEIPYVFRIKNRVNALLRASASIPLYYVPRDLLMLGIRPYPLQPLPPEIDERPKEEPQKKPFVELKPRPQKEPKKASPDNPNYPTKAGVYKEQKKKDAGNKKKADPAKKSAPKGKAPSVFTFGNEPTNGGVTPVSKPATTDDDFKSRKKKTRPATPVINPETPGLEDDEETPDLSFTEFKVGGGNTLPPSSTESSKQPLIGMSFHKEDPILKNKTPKTPIGPTLE